MKIRLIKVKSIQTEEIMTIKKIIITSVIMK